MAAYAGAELPVGALLPHSIPAARTTHGCQFPLRCSCVDSDVASLFMVVKTYDRHAKTYDRRQVGLGLLRGAWPSIERGGTHSPRCQPWSECSTTIVSSVSFRLSSSSRILPVAASAHETCAYTDERSMSGLGFEARTFGHSRRKMFGLGLFVRC